MNDELEGAGKEEVLACLKLNILPETQKKLRSIIKLIGFFVGYLTMMYQLQMIMQ